jgi:hypothetical protein
MGSTHEPIDPLLLSVLIASHDRDEGGDVLIGISRDVLRRVLIELRDARIAMVRKDELLQSGPPIVFVKHGPMVCGACDGCEGDDEQVHHGANCWWLRQQQEVGKR